jgi:hypothetical protein
MRGKNETNLLYCQPALNVVVEIKGPFLGSVKPRTLDTDMIWRCRKRLRSHPEPWSNSHRTRRGATPVARGASVKFDSKGRPRNRKGDGGSSAQTHSDESQQCGETVWIRSGNGETISRLPALAYSPGCWPINRSRRGPSRGRSSPAGMIDLTQVNGCRLGMRTFCQKTGCEFVSSVGVRSPSGAARETPSRGALLSFPM